MKFIQQVGELEVAARSRNFVYWWAVGIGNVNDVIVAVQNHGNECFVVTYELSK